MAKVVKAPVRKTGDLWFESRLRHKIFSQKLSYCVITVFPNVCVFYILSRRRSSSPTCLNALTTTWAGESTCLCKECNSGPGEKSKIARGVTHLPNKALGLYFWLSMNKQVQGFPFTLRGRGQLQSVIIHNTTLSSVIHSQPAIFTSQLARLCTFTHWGEHYSSQNA